MRTIKPKDCALVLTIPLSRETFLNELSMQRKDFLQQIASKYHKLNDIFLWEEIYRPMVATVMSVTQTVMKNGVTVVQNASLADFSDLFRDFRVVTLVAHWRSSDFYPRDFSNPLKTLNALQNPQTPLEERVSRLFFESWTDLKKSIENTNEIHLANLLSIVFNKIINKDELYNFHDSSEASEITYDKHQLMYLNRHSIDTCSFDGLHFGNRIEFFDKSYSIEEVAATVPEDYDGVLDFIVCNSVIIGNEIKRHRKCVVIINKEQTGIVFRMLLYKGIVKLLKHTNTSYIRASTALRMKLFSEEKEVVH